jgi:ribonuclease E
VEGEQDVQATAPVEAEVAAAPQQAPVQQPVEPVVTEAVAPVIAQPVEPVQPVQTAEPVVTAAAAVVEAAPQAIAAAMAEVPAPAPVSAVAKAAPLTIETLQHVVTDVGMTWVHTDAQKLQASQEEAARAVTPPRVPRERKPLPPIQQGPMILVETGSPVGGADQQ